MEKGKKKRILFWLLGLFVFLAFINLMVMFNVSNKVTGNTPQEGSIELEIVSLDSCGDSVCGATETCASCVADCGCSAGYTCTGGSCVADEVPPADDGGGGGGGGGGVVVPPTTAKEYDFKLSQSSLKVQMQTGEYYQKQITVTNTGTKDLVIDISLTNLDDFIILERDSFALKTDESEIIKFNVYASEEIDNDVYLGKINFNALQVSKSLNVVLDIKELLPLFDMNTIILKKYLLPGNLVEAFVEIMNLGTLANISVELEYSIRDFNNETYVSKNKSFVLDRFFNETLSLETPNDLEMGEYIFYSRVVYGDRSASSYDSFFMEKLSFLIWIAIITLIVIIIIILIVVLFKPKKEKEDVQNKKVVPVKSFFNLKKKL